MLIVPASARSNPASSRSRVVFPLPDGPRMAVSEPAGTARSTPVSTGCAPNALYRPATASCLMCLSSPIEEAAEYIAGQRGHHDHDQREWRCLTVGEVLLVGPELGR